MDARSAARFEKTSRRRAPSLDGDSTVDPGGSVIKLSNTQLWVHDQEEALAFYTDKLGFELRADVTLPEMGDFRWLTVGPVAQPDFAIVLMAIPGPPVMEPDTADQVRALMAKGFAGTIFLTTDDCYAATAGTGETRRRVRRAARGTSVRDRLILPRPLREPHPPHPGTGDGSGLTRLRAKRRREGQRDASSPRRRHDRVTGAGRWQSREGPVAGLAVRGARTRNRTTDKSSWKRGVDGSSPSEGRVHSPAPARVALLPAMFARPCRRSQAS